MKRIYFLIFIAFIGLSGCEKDDICDSSTPTTPRLVIEFYDYTNPAMLKPVTDLKVVGTGADGPIVFNDALEEDDEERYLANANKIMLPLKINDGTVEYTLTLNSGNDVLDVQDMIRLNYTRSNQYVSRACGFKTLFTLNPDVNDDTSPFIINNNPAANAGNWIRNVEIVKSNLETENETHVRIYF